mgnify:CR=1 FL=1
MKARLPKGYGSGGANNIQQLARQAQKLQDDMEAVSAALDELYGGAIEPVITDVKMLGAELLGKLVPAV